MKAMGTGLQYFAFTSDRWSSRVNHSYIIISLTIHYIDSQWAIHCCLLKTAECTTDYTADNLATDLVDLLLYWQLLGPVLMQRLQTMLETLFQHLLATCRMLCSHFQLVVQKAMDVPGMARALGWAKQMVSHFHHSVKSHAKSLKKAQTRNLHKSGRKRRVVL